MGTSAENWNANCPWIRKSSAMPTSTTTAETMKRIHFCEMIKNTPYEMAQVTAR